MICVLCGFRNIKIWKHKKGDCLNLAVLGVRLSFEYVCSLEVCRAIQTHKGPHPKLALAVKLVTTETFEGVDKLFSSCII